MLVTNAYLLRKAYDEKYAVGAFNANNLEQIQGIVEAAEEENAPVILQASQGAIKYAGLDMIAAMVFSVAKNTKIPISLHLDHGTDFKQNVQCLRAGFTSLMFDGSLLPFDQNVAITRKVVEIAHPVGVSVEGELGRVGGTEDALTEEEISALMTDPDEAEKFVKLTEVDALAISVGSVHRMRVQAAELDIQRITKIRERTQIPLVLHGSSGVTDDSIRRAIAAGICKINVATALNMAFMRGISSALKEMPDEVDPRRILVRGREELKKVVKEKIRLFGSANKA
ncbi:MAG: class II fructose-1,6-bisphosphate aldolase [Candidatus Bathyarchaeia archaeon]